jgi:mannose-1-phosphate guanylyltransferase/mannose-6-phosphate isomerase
MSIDDFAVDYASLADLLTLRRYWFGGAVMQKILPVVMCGGSGTRLWPESRESLPKQFIPLLDARSTFQRTMLTLAGPVFERPVILTNVDYRFLVAEQLAQIGMEAEIVLEPVRRDSATAVAVAAELALQRGPQSIVGIFAADHMVRLPDVFVTICAEGAAAASDGHIVTLGIHPDHPATGYGYIQPGEALASTANMRRVKAFIEKPTKEMAQLFMAEGYLWNSGNFLFRADVMKDELLAFHPEIDAAAAEAVAHSRLDLQFRVLQLEALTSSPRTSIDYAVMEHTRRAVVMRADIGWSDVGLWSAVMDLSTRDEAGNAIVGDGVIMGARNVMVRSPDRLTAVLGVSDIIVVSTHDATLVLSAAQADKVKDLVAELNLRGRKETIEHKRVYRPWGYYQSIDVGGRHQVKRIVVRPNGSLSSQKHFHRAEHWVVVHGTAEVTIDGAVKSVYENESIFLPMGVVHRLANPGKIDLELIEVQTGSYLGEDDIVRFDDVYNRK